MSLNQNAVTSDDCENRCDDFLIDSGSCDIRLENADNLRNLECKVSHLAPSQQNEFIALLKESVSTYFKH